MWKQFNHPGVCPEEDGDKKKIGKLSFCVIIFVFFGGKKWSRSRPRPKVRILAGIKIKMNIS
jgi:hypothetical protein